MSGDPDRQRSVYKGIDNNKHSCSPITSYYPQQTSDTVYIKRDPNLKRFSSKKTKNDICDDASFTRRITEYRSIFRRVDLNVHLGLLVFVVLSLVNGLQTRDETRGRWSARYSKQGVYFKAGRLLTLSTIPASAA